jgi:hypothetical protein
MIQALQRARLFVLPCLLQVYAGARAIKSYLALFAAALRANPTMHGWTEASFLTLFADSTTHESGPSFDYDIKRAESWVPLCGSGRHPPGTVGMAISSISGVKRADFYGLSRFPSSKNRIKCG